MNVPFIKAPDTVGKLVVEPLSGHFQHDVNLIAKMDPLVVVRFNGDSIPSAVHENGGREPKWQDKLTFQKDITENIVVIEAWSFSEMGSNDFIGVGYTSITECLSL